MFEPALLSGTQAGGVENNPIPPLSTALEETTQLLN